MRRRWVGSLIASTLLAGALFPSIAVSAGTPSVQPSYYLALGDSLAAGTGASTSSSDYVSDLLAYAQPQIPGLDVVNLGCPGESTSSLIGGGVCSYSSGNQLDQATTFIRSHPGQVAFVTIDIGANDVMFCGTNFTCLDGALARMDANLTQILSGLRAASRTVPIIGMSYYDPMLAAWLTGVSGVKQAAVGVKETRQLNADLASTYRRFGAKVASAYKQFDTADTSMTGSWNGQTVPVNVAMVCWWTWMCTGSGLTIHANDTGHAQLAHAFEKVLAVPPTISGTPPNGTAGTAYTFAFSLSGIPSINVRSHGKLPKGLTLSSHGVLSGVPTKGGTYSFTVSASNGKGATAAGTRSVTIAPR